MGRPAAFLDRDGVIGVAPGNVRRPGELQLIPGAARAIRRLNRAGWLVAVFTNQPGVAQGQLSEADLERIHQRLRDLLEAQGARLDGLAFCPHPPESSSKAEIEAGCACRKPGTAMLTALCERLPVTRAASIGVGDSWRDAAAAHAFGLDAIGVRTGHGMTRVPPPAWCVDGRPDVLVENLAEAAELVLAPDPGIEELARRTARELEGAGGRPVLVLVGGASRAGKSVSVFRLRRALRARGLAARWVHLDDWIVPAVERPPRSTLAERFRLVHAQAALHALARGEAVEAPGYDPRSRGPLARRVPYDPRGAGVLLVDGVPALLLKSGSHPCLRVHVEAPSEPERLRRVQVFYRDKGLCPAEIEALIESRREEAESVAAAAHTAHVRLQPTRFEGPRDGAD